MSRKKGFPANQSHYPFLDGAIPSSELDVAVGFLGSSGASSLTVRIGIYQFTGNEMKLHHVVEINPNTGDPIPRHRREKGSPGVLAFDKATANWLKPLLILDNKYPVGEYRWVDDPPVPLSEVDADERRRITGLAHIAPREDFFAMERTIQASSEMVDRMIAHVSECGPPQMPGQIPIVMRRSIDVRGAGSQAVKEVQVPAPLFRAMITTKMIQGLRIRCGKFSEIRYSYASLLQAIDRMIGMGTQTALIESTLRRSSEDIRQKAEGHILSAKMDADLQKMCMKNVDLALAGATAFLRDRQGGTIAAFMPAGEPSGSPPVFERPDFLLVKPHRSVQVLESHNMSFSFPEEGRDLFNVAI
jgi:hypothetical protein